MARKPSSMGLFFNSINTTFALSGLAIMSYALYVLLKLKASTLPDHFHEKHEMARVLLDSKISIWLSYKLPEAWFVYLLLVIGSSLVVISCFGYIGTATRSPCCLYFYSVLLVALFMAQLGAAALMFFNHNWKEKVPREKTGSFLSTYHFFTMHWKIIRWVAIGALALEVIAIVLAMYLSYVSRVSYDTKYNRSRSVVYPGRVMRRTTVEKRRNTNPAIGAAIAAASISGSGSASEGKKLKVVIRPPETGKKNKEDKLSLYLC